MAGCTFVLVVVDRETGEFTIEGPLSDDRAWNRAIVEAQKSGRNVRCFSLGDMTPDRRSRRMAGRAGRSTGRRRFDCGGVRDYFLSTLPNGGY
jgi:hypothetical protein